MKLVAMMIARNEADRYLGLALTSLLGFCDEVCVVDDGSTDDTPYVLAQHDRVFWESTPDSRFYRHEGRARQHLLNFTLARHPSHVLAIDADEFVSDGNVVRGVMEDGAGLVWTLNMQEIWKADMDGLSVRQDGGWREHGVAIMFTVPPRRDARHWRIPDKALACGRVPIAVARRHGVARSSGADILHFGWTRETERDARYQRYVEHDSGRFHQNAHLESIMFGDERVSMTRRPWPSSLPRDMILSYTREEAADDGAASGPQNDLP